jgi:dual specificity protein kinase YAK1
MEPQWTAYSETAAASRQARYAPHNMTTPQHAQRDAHVPPQIKPDPYAAPAVSTASSRTMSLASPTGPHPRGLDYNDGDGDVPMEDADPYKPKLNTGSRSSQQQRQSQQFLQQVQQEESAAARRYSPMNLSPTSPYSGNPQQGGQNYTSFSPQTQSNRQSPTRNNPYMASPNSYYSPPSRFPRHHSQSLSAGMLIRK